MGGKMGFEGDGQGHADTADGFHQHDQPVGDGADQAGGWVVVQMGVGSVARIVAAAMEKLIEGIVPRFSKNQKHDARRCAFY